MREAEADTISFSDGSPSDRESLALFEAAVLPSLPLRRQSDDAIFAPYRLSEFDDDVTALSRDLHRNSACSDGPENEKSEYNISCCVIYPFSIQTRPQQELRSNFATTCIQNSDFSVNYTSGSAMELT